MGSYSVEHREGYSAFDHLGAEIQRYCSQEYGRLADARRALRTARQIVGTDHCRKPRFDIVNNVTGKRYEWA